MLSGPSAGGLLATKAAMKGGASQILSGKPALHSHVNAVTVVLKAISPHCLHAPCTMHGPVHYITSMSN